MDVETECSQLRGRHLMQQRCDHVSQMHYVYESQRCVHAVIAFSANASREKLHGYVPLRAASKIIGRWKQKKRRYMAAERQQYTER